MKKNEIKYKSNKFATLPYFILAAFLAAMIVVAINI